MLKTTVLCLSLMFVSSACNLSDAVSQINPFPTTEARIKAHAWRNFNLAPSQSEFMKLSEEAELPGVERFYISTKGRNHGGDYIYLLWNERLYCSGIEEDFGRFLKDRELLKNPDAEKFMRTVRTFQRLQDELVIEQDRIDKPDEDTKPLIGKIAAPKLIKTDDSGVVFTYFTKMLRGGGAVRKVVVTVTPDYAVAFENSFVE